MSSIPNSAMPHAKASTGESEGGRSLFGQFTDTVRENPRTAIAAGAAVAAAAGVATAAVIGTRSRRTRAKA